MLLCMFVQENSAEVRRNALDNNVFGVYRYLTALSKDHPLVRRRFLAFKHRLTTRGGGGRSRAEILLLVPQEREGRNK